MDYGPFDGVLGFSQGGIITSILTGMRKPLSSMEDNYFQFSFAIFCGTALPSVEKYLHYVLLSNSCAPLDTLHIYGTRDPAVSNEKSRDLISVYQKQALQNNDEDIALNTNDLPYNTSVTYFEHAGGHYIPTNAAIKKVLHHFINTLLKSEAPIS